MFTSSYRPGIKLSYVTSSALLRPCFLSTMVSVPPSPTWGYTSGGWLGQGSDTHNGVQRPLCQPHRTARTCQGKDASMLVWTVPALKLPPDLNPRFQSSPMTQPWASHSTSVCLSFLTYKMGSVHSFNTFLSIIYLCQVLFGVLGIE